jgi:hypothetical protein
LLTIGTKEGRREYLNKFPDIVLFNQIKIYVPYSSRPELIDNLLNLFDTTENNYYTSLIPALQGKIYYGNYSTSEVYSIDMLCSKLEFLTTQKYPLEDKLVILKKIRNLQRLLLDRNMMTSQMASAISRLITTYEENPDAQPLLYYFLLLSPSDIANCRKLFYQKFYYDQTRNCLYIPMVQSDFVNMLPKLYNLNHSIPKTSPSNVHDSNDDLYNTIAYMKLFFGYVPHSIRNI